MPGNSSTSIRVEKSDLMKWGSLAINVKLQYFPHFGAVVRVLQKHRAQHLRLLSLKWREPTQRNESPTSSSLMEMKAQEMKGKESLLSFQVMLFSPSFGSGVSFPHCENSPSRTEAHLPPPVAPRLVPRELRPLWVHNTYSH